MEWTVVLNVNTAKSRFLSHYIVLHHNTRTVTVRIVIVVQRYKLTKSEKIRCYSVCKLWIVIKHSLCCVT